MRSFAVFLGVVLASYAGIVEAMTPAIQSNPGLERSMCKWLLICANDVVLEDALSQLWSAEPNAEAAAVAGFREALRRSPSDASRWANLGDALLRSGSAEDAKYCFDQAVRFAPHSPPVLIRAAHFYDEIQRRAASRSAFRHVLELTRDYDQIVFAYFDRTEQPVGEVLLNAIPDQPEPLAAYFRYQVRKAGFDDLSAIWRLLSERNLADSSLLAEYVHRLIGGQRLDDAVSVQAEFIGDAHRRSWPDRTAIFNGGFEEDFVGSDLAWKITPRDGVLVERVEGQALTGSYALRISFGGREKINVQTLSQDFVVRPGRYRCSASLRSEALNTDQGVFLRIYDLRDRQLLDLATEPVSGTEDWREVSVDFSVAGEPRLMRIAVARKQSRQFDNKISGSVWLDDVQCAAHD